MDDRISEWEHYRHLSSYLNFWKARWEDKQTLEPVNYCTRRAGHPGNDSTPASQQTTRAQSLSSTVAGEEGPSIPSRETTTCQQKVACPGRTFLWRMFELLKSTYPKETTPNLPELIFCTRWQFVLESWNGISTLADSDAVRNGVYYCW